MKKSALILVAGIALSTFASAGTFAPNDNGASHPVVSGATGCELLSEDIRVNTSSRVAGGYACDPATNNIAVSFCHPNGKKMGEAGSFRNTYTNSTAGGSVRIAEDTVCTEGAAETKANTAAGLTLEDEDD